MNRSARFLQGVGIGYATQAIITLTGLWLTPFLLDRLGQRELGLWLMGTQLLTYLALLDVGIIAMLPRETAYAQARDAQPGARGGELQYVIGRTARVALWQLAAMVLATLVATFLMPESWRELRGPILLVFAGFALTFPFRTLHGALLGLQDLGFVGLASFAQWASTTLVTVLLMLGGFGLWSLAIGWVTGQVVATIMWVARMPTRHPGVLPRTIPRMSLAEVRALFGRGIWFSVSQVSVALLLGTDLLIIGRALGPDAVVPYSITGKLIQVLSNQPALLLANAVPALAELHQLRERARLRQASAALAQLMLLGSAAVACAVLAVNRGFVHLWVGPQQYAGDTLTIVLLANMLLRHTQLTATYALHAYGRYDRFVSLVSLADGAVTVATGVALVRLLGPIGAPMGSAIGGALVSVPFLFRALARELDLPVWQILGQYAPVAVRLLPALVVIGAGARAWRPESLPEVIGAGLAAGAVFAVALLPLLRRSPLDAYAAPRIARLRRAMGLGT